MGESPVSVQNRFAPSDYPAVSAKAAGTPFYLMSKKAYSVMPIDTGFFSGSLDPRKLEKILNKAGADEWRLVRTIHETRKVFFLFSRESHFAVFEKDYA